jgi:two-component system, cell cycle response regulator DivK
MAAESILVVDDVPVNLKLTDILLRREGFKVHTSSDAEHALALLRGFHPDLMLVDIELPGMDGFSLTRRIKENPSTKDIVVIALSARASSGDDQKAYAAGCDGYITKPIDSATLVSSIRGHLNRLPGNKEPRTDKFQRTSVPEGTSSGEEDIETLRRRFLEEGALQSRQMLESLTKNFDIHRSARLLHSWVGAAGILGYMTISNLARQAEEALQISPPEQEILRETLSELIIAFQDPLESTPQHAIPVSVTQSLASKPIGVVGFGVDETERICVALEQVGARPRLFHPADPLNTGSVQDCRAIMISVTPDTIATPWLSANSPLAAEQPLVYAGRRDHIMELDLAVQTRASEFLIDGWQPEEALLRLSFAITKGNRSATAFTRTDTAVEAESNPQIATPDIVIADDDPVVRSSVRLALQDYGMQCHMAENGTAALQMIRAQKPHAAVLDVNMPGMDGYLVLAAVRQEKLPVRVVLLTARRHENDISRGFNLGADDYLVKPFNPVELVARLKRLLRR